MKLVLQQPILNQQDADHVRTFHKHPMDYWIESMDFDIYIMDCMDFGLETK